MSVKIKKRGRPNGTQKKLTSEKIVSCAKKLLQEDGKIPSVRKISGALEVDPMAIYHYFPNKAALLENVALSLMRSIYDPVGNKEWQEELKLLCHSYLMLLQKYSGLLETMLSMKSESPAQVFMERFHKIMLPLKISEKTLSTVIDFLADYLHGFALSMHCNRNSKQLTIEMSNEPLFFYMRALEREIIENRSKSR